MQADWPTRFPLRDDPYAVVRWEVVLGTTLPGVPDDEAIPHLTRYLHDEDAIVRAYARWALDNRLRNGPPVSETG
jgi:HEAT repeat protein